jgi:hypothetical protein
VVRSPGFHDYSATLTMRSTIARVFAPVVFPGDEEKTRQAAVFNLCYWYFSGLALLILVGNLLGDTVAWEVTVNSLVALALGLVCLRWVRQGKVTLAAWVLLALYFAAATRGVALLGTIRVPSLGVYALLVVATGLLFGGRAMVGAIVLCSLAVAGLVAAENAGWLPRPNYRVGVTQWVTATTLFACIGGLIITALAQVRAAMRRVEDALAERARSEAALRDANTRLQEALANVKTLKGLLPVCSWCHKVREDEGYWQQIETYVAAHSDATFTHGICPDCRARHFPGTTRRCTSTPPGGGGADGSS